VYHLPCDTGRQVLAASAQKVPDTPGLALRRGDDRTVAVRRFYVVDDILTTDETLRHPVAAVVAAVGMVIGAAVPRKHSGVDAGDLASAACVPAGLEVPAPRAVALHDETTAIVAGGRAIPRPSVVPPQDHRGAVAQCPGAHDFGAEAMTLNQRPGGDGPTTRPSSRASPAGDFRLACRASPGGRPTRERRPVANAIRWMGRHAS
jgi:hypothetical protein